MFAIVYRFFLNPRVVEHDDLESLLDLAISTVGELTDTDVSLDGLTHWHADQHLLVLEAEDPEHDQVAAAFGAMLRLNFGPDAFRLSEPETGMWPGRAFRTGADGASGDGVED